MTCNQYRVVTVVTLVLFPSQTSIDNRELCAPHIHVFNAPVDDDFDEISNHFLQLCCKKTRVMRAR